MAADLPPAAPPDPPAVVAPAPAAAETIYVDTDEYHYSVLGNTLLPRETIEAAIKSAKTPKDALDALNRAYVDAGYFLVVIGGEVDKKLVAFRVLQGRIAEIEAPDDLRPYFKGIYNRSDLTQSTLIRDSALAEIYSSRQGVRPKGTFSPSKEIGGTKLTVVEEEIPDAKPWAAGLAFNNLGGRFSSRYTWGASGSVRPGGGLELTGTYTQGIPGLTSESAGASYKIGTLGASLVTPWGIYALNYSQTQYQIGEAGAPVFPAGTVEFGGITGTQLVYSDATTRFVLTEGLTRYSNVQSVFDGLSDIVDQNYTVGNVGAAYNRNFSLLGQNSSFGATVTVAKGFSARSGTFLPADLGIPDPHFILGQGSVTGTFGLPYGLSAGIAINGQYTSFVLPQSQQWVLGGFGNLSAWLPAVLIGDSGALGRVTLSSPTWQWSTFTFNASGFGEAGMSRLEQRGAGEPYTRALGDAGFSISGNTAKGTSLTLAYAWPVWYRNIDGIVRDNVDRNRANLYFTLNQSF